MKFFLAILLLCDYSFSQQFTPGNVLENIRTKYSQMRDISADFIQSVRLRYKQNGQKISGSILLKKGDRYRIETDQQTIVTDGKKVWMYSPTNKQVLIDVFNPKRQQFTPDKFLTGLPKDFSATALDTAGRLLILTLMPTKNTSISTLMTDIKVWVNKDSWLFERVDYNNSNGTQTSIILSNILFNKGIADSNFRFEITSDMKVIDVNSLKP